MSATLSKSKRTDFALFLDRYLCGALVFICALLKSFSPGFKPFHKSEVREIVVSKYVGLGSILLTQKLLGAIRQNFPEARITFLTFDMNEKLLSLIMRKWVDDVVLIQTTPSFSLIRSTFRAISLLRKRRVDLFLDIEFFSRYSAVMCFLSRPKASVGYESLLLWHRTSLYSHPAKFVSQAHIAENFVNPLRTLGIEVPFEMSYIPSIELPKEEGEKAVQKISALGLSRDGFIIFNPNASDALGGYRKWPQDKWVQLALDTLRSVPLSVVFTGLREDTTLVNSIVSRVGDVNGRVKSLAGMLDIVGYLTLISMCRLVVTIDSGTSHFSAALNKPTVTLFGPEWPGLYGYTSPNCRTVYKSLFCSPCYNIHHGKKIVCNNENRCMTTIEPEEVRRQMETLLQHA